MLDILVTSLGLTLLQSLWQGAFIYTALLFVLRVNPNMKASTRHNLAALAMIGIVSWTLFTFSAEFFTLGHSVAQRHVFASPPNDQRSVFSLRDTFINGFKKNISWVVLIYAAGLMVQSAKLLNDFYNIRRLRLKEVSAVPSSLQAQFLCIINKTGIRKKVSIGISKNVFVPMVLGHIKPAILLPVSAVTNLDADQIEAILIHELAHICRNDYLINVIKVFVETMLFFNPFVGMVGKMMDIERENACDDFVLKHISNPVIYMETLLQIQEMKSDNQQLALAIGGKKHQLLNRIRRIARGDAQELPARHLLYLPLLVAVFVLVSWLPAKFAHQLVKPNLKLTGNLPETISQPKTKKSKIFLDRSGHSWVSGKSKNNKPHKSQEAPSIKQYPVLNLDGRTDTVKIRPSATTATTYSQMYKGIYVIGDNIYEEKQLREALKQSTNKLDIVLNDRPEVGYYTPDDANAIKRWGLKAKNGVIFALSRHNPADTITR